MIKNLIIVFFTTQNETHEFTQSISAKPLLTPVLCGKRNIANSSYYIITVPFSKRSITKNHSVKVNNKHYAVAKEGVLFFLIEGKRNNGRKEKDGLNKINNKGKHQSILESILVIA